MAQRVAGIVSGDESDIHDEPHLDGSRITVRYVQRQVEDRGVSPERVADQHAIELADVYAALTYYYSNPDEMATVERRRAERSSEAAERTTLIPPEE